MEFNIALLRGDGIGPEIVDSAVEVLKKTAEKFGHKFNFTPYLIGGAAIDETGVPLPDGEEGWPPLPYPPSGCWSGGWMWHCQ